MKVVFLPAAEQDLGELFSYIRDELQNNIAATNTATKILRRAQSLGNFPEMGASFDAIDARLAGYRYLLVGNYLVVYRITDQVSVVRIMYARSDYMNLLVG